MAPETQGMPTRLGLRSPSAVPGLFPRDLATPQGLSDLSPVCHSYLGLAGLAGSTLGLQAESWTIPSCGWAGSLLR